MPLTSTVFAGIGGLLTSAIDIGSRSHKFGKEADIALASGTGASQADQLFTDQRSLAASANEDLDLAASLVDAFGTTLTFVKIKAISIRAKSTNGGTIDVKPATVNGFLGPFNAVADTIKIPAGGAVVLAAPVAGWTVTAGTGDLLNFTNSDGAAAGVYDVRIVGTSA